jgi:outer membrane biosynthesis protein TonB
MPSGKTILAAGAALVALGGAGAGAWIASSDDEGDPAPFEHSLTPDTDDSEPTNEQPVVPTEQEPAAPQPEREPQPEEQPQAPDAAPEQDKPKRIQFPRERKQQPNDSPERVFEVPPAREFSGTGNASLGTVNLSTAAIVKWTTKGRFELRFGREEFPIVAPSPSGQLIVPPYRFEKVRVIARGRWTIRIVPQK